MSIFLCFVIWISLAVLIGILSFLLLPFPWGMIGAVDSPVLGCLLFWIWNWSSTEGSYWREG